MCCLSPLFPLVLLHSFFHTFVFFFCLYFYIYIYFSLLLPSTLSHFFLCSSSFISLIPFFHFHFTVAKNGLKKWFIFLP